MRRSGGTAITAVVGPCIHAECYEFGADDLDALAARFGPAVRPRTAWGTPALDLPAAIADEPGGRWASTVVDIDRAVHRVRRPVLVAPGPRRHGSATAWPSGWSRAVTA